MCTADMICLYFVEDWLHTVARSLNPLKAKWQNEKTRKKRQRRKKWEFQSIKYNGHSHLFLFLFLTVCLTVFNLFFVASLPWNYGCNKKVRDLAIGDKIVKAHSWQGTITWMHFGHIHNHFLCFNDLFWRPLLHT